MGKRPGAQDGVSGLPGVVLVSCQGQRVICQPWCIIHPHPAGWGAGRGAGNTHSHHLTRGTLALLSVSPLAQKHRAKQGVELPAPSPPTRQDRRENGKMPTGGTEGSTPRFSVPHREEFFPISQLISHLHHHKPSGVSAHLTLGAIPKPLIPVDAPSPSVWVLCPDGK